MLSRTVNNPKLKKLARLIIAIGLSSLVVGLVLSFKAGWNAYGLVGANTGPCDAKCEVSLKRITALSKAGKWLTYGGLGVTAAGGLLLAKAEGRLSNPFDKT